MPDRQLLTWDGVTQRKTLHLHPEALSSPIIPIALAKGWDIIVTPREPTLPWSYTGPLDLRGWQMHVGSAS